MLRDTKWLPRLLSVPLDSINVGLVETFVILYRYVVYCALVLFIKSFMASTDRSELLDTSIILYCFSLVVFSWCHYFIIPSFKTE